MAEVVMQAQNQLALKGDFQAAQVALLAWPEVSAQSLRVDLSGVTRFDSSLLAWLLGLAERSKMAGGKLVCVAASPAFMHLLDLYQVNELIELEAA
jgi:ABC-type transporter Mla MlaB component